MKRSLKLLKARSSSSPGQSGSKPTAPLKKKDRSAARKVKTRSPAPASLDKKSQKRADETPQPAENVPEFFKKTEATRADKKSRKNVKKDKGEKHEKRFIVFAGNLPLDTTAEQLKLFFKNKLQSRIVGVRVLTHRGTNKPKGCAFVEFDCREALEIALNYHHRELGGRKINIELSAGGGGNSKKRREKISKKNAELKKHRRMKVKQAKKPEQSK
ncbi:RNA recognition motif-containing protein [Besnoitia besnoiti]|uniref:RNA recognition motif-containing protein n=1 Tax=Besnoitia besnoiti TaxID=94643 RepID=A0A2A9MEB1_BESBE|nr:RNA recognition motif-containing protein [Besnoitia besnoiti]PFH33720.1 RNA recognition motif-containing protein [Besnoitia besnoiti]